MDLTPTRPHLTPARPGHLGPRHQPVPFDPSVVTKTSLHSLVFRSLKRSHELFLTSQYDLPPEFLEATKISRPVRARDQYDQSLNPSDSLTHPKPSPTSSSKALAIVSSAPNLNHKPHSSLALVPVQNQRASKLANTSSQSSSSLALTSNSNSLLVPRRAPTMPKPQWHSPWILTRCISGHTGWVRCLAIDPSNDWFASGSNDRLIKIWDLASGKLKLSLTGHISHVRGLAISARQPYLFSVGEDKTVKCWDLEVNKVVRSYHGHLSGVYCIDLHPALDVLVTGGRDSCARLWDMRTKAQIHAFSGHTSTVATVKCQASEPQVITGSHDSTIKLWDIVSGKARVTLTHHKKSVRAIQLHPTLNMFVSGAPDNIKQWTCPDGEFVKNLSGHNAIVNCLAVNEENVLVSASDNGLMYFWDWKSGYNFQIVKSIPQPGSLESEAGVFACTFDRSGTRLITAEADKTIKVYKEDEKATEETHPINWKPDIITRRKF